MISKIIRGIGKRILRPNTSKYAKFNISWLKEKYLKHADPNKRYIHSYNKHIKVIFSDPLSFLHATKEIFVDEIYLFRTTNKNPFIIDCGGYIGMSALFFKLNYPDSKVIVFEPDSENYKLAKENIESWKFKDVELLNKAVWVNNNYIEFSESNGMASSINSINSGGKVVKVMAARLREYLNKKIDFLKIDIEGAEYEVMQDIKDALHFVEHLFVEYHGFFHEMHKLNTILNILTEEKFEWYIKEAADIYGRPFFDKKTINTYDVQLNIFAFKP